MLTFFKRAAIGMLAVLVFVSLFPSSAAAQSRTRYNRADFEQWRAQWQQTEEGESDVSAEEAEQAQTSSRGTTSATRKKIDALDDDEVEDLPIPILFGVGLSNLFKNFGDPRDGGARSHEGLDIMALKGTPILSPTEAVVTRTGTGESSGKYVYTANPGGETFAYMHLDVIAEIKAGDELEAGDIIGYVGNTGNAAGGAAHLHFEIRKNRKATDPFPRLTKVFTLKEKIESVEAMLKTEDDTDDLVEFLVENFRSDLLAAQASGIDLPNDIEDELADTAATAVVSSSVRDLTLGSQGTDVSALQTFLITEDVGSAAKALKDAGATGYFGSITQRALSEYQAKHGITPSAGYYGPLTRAYIAAHK